MTSPTAPSIQFIAAHFLVIAALAITAGCQQRTIELDALLNQFTDQDGMVFFQLGDRPPPPQHALDAIERINEFCRSLPLDPGGYLASPGGRSLMVGDLYFPRVEKHRRKLWVWPDWLEPDVVLSIHGYRAHAYLTDVHILVQAYRDKDVEWPRGEWFIIHLRQPERRYHITGFRRHRIRITEDGIIALIDQDNALHFGYLDTESETAQLRKIEPEGESTYENLVWSHGGQFLVLETTDRRLLSIDPQQPERIISVMPGMMYGEHVRLIGDHSFYGLRGDSSTYAVYVVRDDGSLRVRGYGHGGNRPIWPSPSGRYVLTKGDKLGFWRGGVRHTHLASSRDLRPSEPNPPESARYGRRYGISWVTWRRETQ